MVRAARASQKPVAPPPQEGVEVPQHQGIHPTMRGHDAKGPCEKAAHYVQVLVHWQKGTTPARMSPPRLRYSKAMPRTPEWTSLPTPQNVGRNATNTRTPAAGCAAWVKVAHYIACPTMLAGSLPTSCRPTRSG